MRNSDVLRLTDKQPEPEVGCGTSALVGDSSERSRISFDPTVPLLPAVPLRVGDRRRDALGEVLGDQFAEPLQELLAEGQVV